MRKKIISLLALFSMLMGTGAQAQDYYVAHGADVNVSHALQGRMEQHRPCRFGQ